MLRCTKCPYGQVVPVTEGLLCVDCGYLKKLPPDKFDEAVQSSPEDKAEQDSNNKL